MLNCWDKYGKMLKGLLKILKCLNGDMFREQIFDLKQIFQHFIPEYHNIFEMIKITVVQLNVNYIACKLSGANVL